MSTLLSEIELYMRATKVPQTRFGRLATGDSRFVLDLQHGRNPKPELAEKVRSYMQANSQPYTGRGPKHWTPQRDADLCRMIAEGTSRQAIADALGVTLSAVNNRCTGLAKRHWPDRAQRQGLTRHLNGPAMSTSGLSL